MPDVNRPKLEVFLEHSVLVDLDGSRTEFFEGDTTVAAKKRLREIRDAFERGFLREIIEYCQDPENPVDPLEPRDRLLFSRLVDSVTSEVGRAIVGLTILQLAVKSIKPDQSIRLHKGGRGNGGFSWVDGIPMRVLDKDYCTPLLREYNLLKINADGVFMTRSLAENYPYSKLYKAALRGAREEWLEIVDLLEGEKIDPLLSLKNLIRMLFNRSYKFRKDAEVLMCHIHGILERVTSIDETIAFMKGYIDTTEYSARVFEICLHSLFQVLEEEKCLDGFLKPLSQMRSANKKHGNIGDVEVIDHPGSLQILEAWDAKYGKPYLRDELDELSEKLSDHPEAKLVGFVVDGDPDMRSEIRRRIESIKDTYSVEVEIQSFAGWVKKRLTSFDLIRKEEAIAKSWLLTFAECLCQLRRESAPIDEPSDAWVVGLTVYLQQKFPDLTL